MRFHRTLRVPIPLNRFQVQNHLEQVKFKAFRRSHWLNYFPHCCHNVFHQNTNGALDRNEISELSQNCFEIMSILKLQEKSCRINLPCYLPCSKELRYTVKKNSFDFLDFKEMSIFDLSKKYGKMTYHSDDQSYKRYLNY